MSNNLISLIIPCYNAESTLSKCLDSVINQSYRNIEIIVINDGSTDETSKILKQFQDDDSRIIVINQENSGVSKARNQGIQIASGDYICFVDSDDWVENNYCSVLHRTITEHNADISIAEAAYEDETGILVHNYNLRDASVTVYDQQTALKLLLEDKIIQSHPWAKLYRSHLLKNISFPENLEAFEDYYTMFKIFNDAKKVVKSDKVIYHYIQFENSLSHNLTPKRAYHFFLALMEAYHFLMSQNIDVKFRKTIIRNILKKSFMVLKRIIRNTQSSEMVFEKEAIRNFFSQFMSYGITDIGPEYYLYLRLYHYYPKLYVRLTKK